MNSGIKSSYTTGSRISAHQIAILKMMVTLRDGMRREVGVGVQDGGHMYTHADLCQCMAKISPILSSN